MDDEGRALAQWAHDEELAGEVLFAALRDACAGEDVAAHFDILRELEVRTAAIVRPLVLRLGGTPATEVEPERRQAIVDFARRTPPSELWPVLLRAVDEPLARYRRLGELLDADDEEGQEVVAHLVAHEEALRSYAEGVQSGAADPLAAVRRLRDLGDEWSPLDGMRTSQ